MSNEKVFTRRCFVKKTLQIAAGIVLTSPLVDPWDSFAAPATRPMSFYHTHTGERLTITYSCDGCSPATLNRLNNFLKDFRTGEVHPIDPALLDILYGIQRQSGSRGVFEIISGYRSPQTNSLLRAKTNGVAKKSLHTKGRALDLRVTDLTIRDLRDVAIRLRTGGVGYYTKSNFVHLDTGRFRTW